MSKYEFNRYTNCDTELEDLTYFYEYVIGIIKLINQDDSPSGGLRDEDDDMKYVYVNNAVSKLTYAECDMLICEIGLRNAFYLFDNSGYDDNNISIGLFKNIKGIRMVLFGIIMYCIDEVDEE
jgi:hypothetical protein